MALILVVLKVDLLVAVLYHLHQVERQVERQEDRVVDRLVVDRVADRQGDLQAVHLVARAPAVLLLEEDL